MTNEELQILHIILKFPFIKWKENKITVKGLNILFIEPSGPTYVCLEIIIIGLESKRIRLYSKEIDIYYYELQDFIKNQQIEENKKIIAEILHNLQAL